ncbi:autotransporter [Bartonella australis AUST/NH1]|uniref:Autotransporter n=1 Tax=Bartonella australis (strain Aust/NH1) TaxID=1094489 RepID=M1N4S1_BARAA|nr:autotransporter outer membrane beta-barrel domain-containing protein [Bartonella australis]AGF74894.1 autotransporter [Bartonella australis AUST/NH1]
MTPVFKNRMRLYAFTTALFSFLPNMGAAADAEPAKEAICGEKEQFYQCNNGKENILENQSYYLGESPQGEGGSKFFVAMTVEGSNTAVDAKNIKIAGTRDLLGSAMYEESPDSKGTFIAPKSYGVFAKDGGSVIISDSTIKNVAVGVLVDGGAIKVRRGVIEAAIGAFVKKEEAFTVLTDTKIKIVGDRGQDFPYAAIMVLNDAYAKVNDGLIDVENADGFHINTGGHLILDGATISLKNDVVRRSNGAIGWQNDVVEWQSDAAESQDGNEKQEYSIVDPSDFYSLFDFRGGEINFTNGSAVAKNAVGLLIREPVNDNKEGVELNDVDFENSSITIKGSESYGIYFSGEKGKNNYEMQRDEEGEEDEEEDEGEEDENGNGEGGGYEGDLPSQLWLIRLARSSLSVPDNVALYASDAEYSISLEQGAEISGDLLLDVQGGSFIPIFASGSSLKGGSRVGEGASAHLSLSNGSTWTVTQRKWKGPQVRYSASNVGDSFSSISVVNLSDSSVIFERLSSMGYQTLSIGNGVEKVYVADGDARLYFNAGGLPGNQTSDRLFIRGDVSGTTTIHVRSVPESSERYMRNEEDSPAISLIQVSGKAQEDSFRLGSGYVTLNGLPYPYRLRAYGPDSSLGPAEADRNLLGREGYKGFWDFRLENEYIKSSSGSHSEAKVRTVVPQVSTYLLLPNAVFHSGLMDVSNQNKQAEAMRAAPQEFLNKRTSFFTNAYGGRQRYASDLSKVEYGYGGDIHYDAAEAGISLKAVESGSVVGFFGAMGTYGKFSLQPEDVEGSKKSKFEKWSAAVYGSLQHNTGLYVNGLLSYGLFEGDVSTDARGKTASIKGKPLSASLTSGKAFAVESEGLVFDPQVQLIYQRIFFDKARDIDNFDIDMGQPEQWTMRVGGRLSKRLMTNSASHSVSLYGKLYVSNDLHNKQFVSFGDDFQLGALGSSLEAGAGVHAQLSSKFALYGDLSYQHKLTSAGFSGTSFSGGMRYRF